jgi:hypothetical protein
MLYLKCDGKLQLGGDIMEKKEKKLFYDSARLEIVKMQSCDVVTTSGIGTSSPFDPEGDMDDAWT